MRTIQIFEQSEGCCGPGQSASLSSFLERKFRDVATVTVYDLAHTQNAPLPPALLDLFVKFGESALPALVVDQSVVCSGKLPSFLEAVSLINGIAGADGAGGGGNGAAANLASGGA